VDLLKRLCDTPGVAGFEEPIQAIVAEELGKTTDEVKIDRLGNVIGFKRGGQSAVASNRLKLMISAHIDEIGFMVRFIDKDGFLRFAPIGGYDPRTLIAQRVIVHGRKALKGVIAPQANWLLTEEEKQKTLPIKDLFIDVGLTREEVVKLVKVGDVISLAAEFEELNEKVILGRNFDDRLGVYVMLEAMRRLRGCQVDVFAVGSVQEELGVRGATTAAFAIEPDLGIALDGSLSSDLPSAREDEKCCLLGGGTGIYVMDRLTVSSKRMVNFLIHLAEKYGVKYQINIGGGTDASAMQRSRSGVYACTIGPPTRYMHSVTQLCHKEDLENTIELLRLFIENAHELSG